MPNLSRIRSGVPTQDRSESPFFRICRTFFEIFNTRSDDVPELGKHKDECQRSSPSTGERQDTPGGGRGPPPNKNKNHNFRLFNHKNIKITPRRMGGRPGRPAGGPYRARSASLGGLGVKPPEKRPRPDVWPLPSYSSCCRTTVCYGFMWRATASRADASTAAAATRPNLPSTHYVCICRRGIRAYIRAV
jgi:hypothetical protein